jgi:succinate dehydrogenase / fumarate reductase cytochrome b subunit
MQIQAQRWRTTVLRLFASTVGKKAVMALTGVFLGLFVLAHLLGNLLAFAGPAAINGYGAALHGRPWLLWPLRAALLAAAGLHTVAAWQLSLRAHRARPQGYAVHRLKMATWSARAMRLSGVLLLGFVVFHLLHLTWGVGHPAFVAGAVYHNVVVGLGVPAVALFYLAGVAALALHLDHGLSSLWRSLGLSPLDDSAPRHKLARAVALAVGLGFAAIPLAVLFKVLR